jgi:hypothetical protein
MEDSDLLFSLRFIMLRVLRRFKLLCFSHAAKKGKEMLVRENSSPKATPTGKRKREGRDLEGTC